MILVVTGITEAVVLSTLDYLPSSDNLTSRLDPSLVGSFGCGI